MWRCIDDPRGRWCKQTLLFIPPCGCTHMHTHSHSHTLCFFTQPPVLHDTPMILISLFWFQCHTDSTSPTPSLSLTSPSTLSSHFTSFQVSSPLPSPLLTLMFTTPPQLPNHPNRPLSQGRRNANHAPQMQIPHYRGGETSGGEGAPGRLGCYWCLRGGRLQRTGQCEYCRADPTRRRSKWFMQSLQWKQGRETHAGQSQCRGTRRKEWFQNKNGCALPLVRDNLEGFNCLFQGQNCRAKHLWITRPALTWQYSILRYTRICSWGDVFFF